MRFSNECDGSRNESANLRLDDTPCHLHRPIKRGSRTSGRNACSSCLKMNEDLSHSTAPGTGDSERFDSGAEGGGVHAEDLAAPLSPEIRQPVASRARIRFFRSNASNSWIVRISDRTTLDGGDFGSLRRLSDFGKGAIKVEPAVLRGDDGPLDDVRQLPDVAGPGIRSNLRRPSSEGDATRRPNRCANLLVNAEARSATSSPRSRTGGSRIGKTFSR